MLNLSNCCLGVQSKTFPSSHAHCACSTGFGACSFDFPPLILNLNTLNPKPKILKRWDESRSQGAAVFKQSPSNRRGVWGLGFRVSLCVAHFRDAQGLSS